MEEPVRARRQAGITLQDTLALLLMTVETEGEHHTTLAVLLIVVETSLLLSVTLITVL